MPPARIFNRWCSSSFCLPLILLLLLHEEARPSAPSPPSPFLPASFPPIRSTNRLLPLRRLPSLPSRLHGGKMAALMRMAISFVGRGYRLNTNTWNTTSRTNNKHEMRTNKRKQSKGESESQQHQQGAEIREETRKNGNRRTINVPSKHLESS